MAIIDIPNGVTDRKSGLTRTTAKDMTRIARNLYLQNRNRIERGKPEGISLDGLKMSYKDTDIVTKEQWDLITSKAKEIDHFGLNITDSTDYINLNNIEKALYYDYIDLYYGRKRRLATTLSFRTGGRKF